MKELKAPGETSSLWKKIQLLNTALDWLELDPETQLYLNSKYNLDPDPNSDPVRNTVDNFFLRF